MRKLIILLFLAIGIGLGWLSARRDEARWRWSRCARGLRRNC
jgi:hypothetical protein